MRPPLAAGSPVVDGSTLYIGVASEEEITGSFTGCCSFRGSVVALDSATGKLASGPEIHARGSGIDDAALEGVRSKVQEALEK